MSRLETDKSLIDELIASARSLDTVVVVPGAVVAAAAAEPLADVAPAAVKIAWDDSGSFTQFLLKWSARPKVFSLTKVFVDELIRRRGLRAYGVPLMTKKSKVNALGSVQPLVPRRLIPARSEESLRAEAEADALLNDDLVSDGFAVAVAKPEAA